MANDAPATLFKDAEPAEGNKEQLPGAEATAAEDAVEVELTSKSVRKRVRRPYPGAAFSEALEFANNIQEVASGRRVRLLTLLKKLDRTTTSSSTRMLITNAGKYGVTSGSYNAEYIELTSDGAVATDPNATARDRLSARFKLAVDGVEPFALLYKEFSGKRMPEHEVMKDVLRESGLPIDDFAECVDVFVVNCKFLGVIEIIGGSEMLLPIDQVLEELPAARAEKTPAREFSFESARAIDVTPITSMSGGSEWDRTCFYIAPIGQDGSDERKHSDLFLNHIVEPALKSFDLKIVRADKIGEAGVITAQILEHLLRCRLVVVDLSLHNPNVFYELAIRHATKLPIVQIIQKCDRIPFDINQMRTVIIDTTDIYSLVPHLETYRSEIATVVRSALNNGDNHTNPLTVFCPGFQVSIPPLR